MEGECFFPSVFSSRGQEYEEQRWMDSWYEQEKRARCVEEGELNASQKQV